MKRLNYYQVHKNKKPRVHQNLKFISLRRNFQNIARAASKVTGTLISLEYSMAPGAGKIGQIVCFADSPGGSI
jgi:hypothetical protein